MKSEKNGISQLHHYKNITTKNVMVGSRAQCCAPSGYN